MNKLYSAEAIEDMKHDHARLQSSSSIRNVSDVRRKERVRRFHAYKNGRVVQETIDDNDPLAAMIDNNQNAIYILVGWGGPKAGIQINLVNEEIMMNTYTFNVTLSDDLMRFQTNEHLQNGNNGFISCMLLPLHKFDEDGSSSSVKYYVHTEEHQELMCGDFSFGHPKPYIRKSYVETIDVSRATDVDEINFINITDREWCCSFIEKNVVPIDGYDSGLIVSFKYCHSRRTRDDAQWTVHYFRDPSLSRCVRKDTMNIEELMNVIIGT